VSDTGARQQAYWRATLRLTAALLLIWAAVSFLPAWFADELNAIVFFGWPLGFYMAAQGALIVFLLIVWFYDRWMNRLERRHGMYNED
jgi:putative solute:sodium symporter small subunit